MLAVTFAQYETNYRVPRKDLVTEMAKILNVNPLTLHEPTTMDASELMEILFWIDEFNPTAINLFQLETYPGEKCNSNELRRRHAAKSEGETDENICND